MIDLKIEAWQIAALGVSRAARIAIQREVIALCRRVAEEQLEEAAKVCDERAAYYCTTANQAKDGYTRTVLGNQEIAATYLAAAIRSRKEQEGWKQ